jgi:Tol biopolymer transport system component
VIGQSFGPYQVLDKLGEGGMGEVYRVRDPRLDRQVAIKVLHAARAGDAEATARFEQEARATAALSHPHICAIYDVGHAEISWPGGTRSVSYLVMELLEGETLQRRLLRGPFDIATLIQHGIALADALDAAHRRGILHRDLKPGNIFLTSHGVKILDFGLAKAVGRSDNTTRLAEPRTADGVIVGTPIYMSPEQLRAEELDVRSDVFSLGIVLYEMATGRRPFNGGSEATITAAILSARPEPPHVWRPDVPPALSETIMKTLETDRELRCQSAAELRADFKRLERSAIGDRDKTPPPEVLRPASSASESHITAPVSDARVAMGLVRRYRTGVIVTLLLAVAAVVGILKWSRADVSPPAAGPVNAPYSVEALTLSGDASLGVVSVDGQFVAYVRRIGVESSLWVRQLPGGTAYQRVAPVEGREYIGLTMAPDSKVDFVARINSAMPQLFRVSLVGTGEPRGIATDVGSATGWSPDGRHFAFIRSKYARGQYWLLIADADGSNQRVLATAHAGSAFLGSTFGQPTPTGRPSWSPDGRRVMAVARPPTDAAREAANTPFDLMVFDASSGAEERTVQVGRGIYEAAWLDDTHAVVSSGASAQLRSVDLASGVVSEITRDVAEYRTVTMRPDMKAAVTTRADSRSGIWIGSADGTAMEEVVPESPAEPAGVSLTLDGRLVYASDTGHGRAVFIAQAGQTPKTVVEDATMPVITRDGRTVLFRRTARAGGGLWRANADGSDARRLVADDVVHGPILVPDDAHFIYTTGRGAERSLFIMPVEGGEPRLVTTQLISGPIRPFVSVDGRRVRLRMSMPDSKLYAFECDLPDCGHQLRQPLDAVGLHVGRSWTPDGRSFALIEKNDLANIWVQLTSGGPERRLTNFRDKEISDLAWSPDGKRLAVTRRSVVSDIVLVKFR